VYTLAVISHSGTVKASYHSLHSALILLSTGLDTIGIFRPEPATVTIRHGIQLIHCFQGNTIVCRHICAIYTCTSRSLKPLLVMIETGRTEDVLALGKETFLRWPGGVVGVMGQFSVLVGGVVMAEVDVGVNSGSG
jgi:hypothetical protein